VGVILGVSVTSGDEAEWTGEKGRGRKMKGEAGIVTPSLKCIRIDDALEYFTDNTGYNIIWF